MSKHTPEDWTWKYDDTGIKVSIVSGYVTARFNQDNEKMREEAEANARLIIASPKMLVVLKKILSPGTMSNVEWEQAHTDAHNLLVEIDTEQNQIKAYLCPHCKAPIYGIGECNYYCDNCDAIVKDAELEIGIAPGLEDCESMP